MAEVQPLTLLLPDEKLDERTIRLGILSCENLVSNSTSIFKFQVFCEADNPNFSYLEGFGVRHVNELYSGAFVAFYEKTTTILNSINIDRTNLFWLDKHNLITTIDGLKSDALLNAKFQHIFEQLLPDQVSSAGSFPFGLLQKNQKLMPLDAFGHRINANFEELKCRKDNHKVIAIFGGSAAQSLYSPSNLMFSYLLEKKLNKISDRKTFSVLNFAMSGHLVFDEFLHYLMFCDELSPDWVITFDGWNDLANGLINDPFLICEFKLNYRYQEEDRAKLHNGYNNNQDTTSSKEKIIPVNSPNAAIEAYLHRLSQFNAFLSHRCVVHLALLQPALFSKKKISPEEVAALESGDNNPKLTDIFDLRLPRVFDKVPEKHAGFEIISLHKKFSEAESPLFADRVHFSVEGEHLVAELLFRELTNRGIFA